MEGMFVRPAVDLPIAVKRLPAGLVVFGHQAESGREGDDLQHPNRLEAGGENVSLQLFEYETGQHVLNVEVNIDCSSFPAAYPRLYW